MISLRTRPGEAEFRSQANLLEQDYLQSPSRSSEFSFRVTSHGLLEVSGPVGTRTIVWKSEADPQQIDWLDPDHRALHVIDCSGTMKNRQQASLLLHELHQHTYKELLDRDIDVPDQDLNHGGAMKVLVAGSPAADIPRFWPGVNLEEYKVEDYIVACAPPSDSSWSDAISEIDYARNVLQLISTSINPACRFIY